MCDGASLTVTSNSLLTDPLWRGHRGEIVQGFKFHGCLQEREIDDKRYDGPALQQLCSVSLCVKVSAVTHRTRFSQCH